MKVTFSVIKADVGSIGGHTKPSDSMMKAVREAVAAACSGPKRILIDGMVTHTGDDIALLMSHEHGVGAKAIHEFAWNCFITGTEVAKKQGLYGAGQDLLVDAPSGNIRGAGPGVAEIEFERNPSSKERPAEAILVFAADKCSPGAFNYPLYSVFCDPMHNGGLLLSPKLHKGFTFTIIDMDHRDRDRLIRLDVPERAWDVAALLKDPDRFTVEAIHSRHKPDEQIVAVSATRLHNIAGKYTGKDDPVAVVRTQGIFPAPEEVVEPYLLGHFVTGDCRGSHVMPIMPMAVLPADRFVSRVVDGCERDVQRTTLGYVRGSRLAADPAESAAQGGRVAPARLHRTDDGGASGARIHRYRGHVGSTRKRVFPALNAS
jgi:fructose 1,6-bisphosphate aldolase/phosphatase